MIRVSLDDALPSMRLARPALSAEGRTLLGQGAVLTDAFLERMRALDVRRIWIHDDRVADVGEMEFFMPRTRAGVAALMNSILADLATDRNAARNVLRGSALTDLVDECLDGRRLPIPAPEPGPMESPLVGHSTRVCMLVAAVGSELPLGREAAVNQAAGALLHDLGHAISRTSEGGGSPDALDLISEDHTSLGFEVVVRARRLSATIAVVCLQHHEHWDGSGTPRRLKADKIHPYAALTAVADRYDNLVTGKTPMLPHQALQRLDDEAGGRLDARLVAYFRKRVAPYPTGTPLLLDGGQQAVVVGLTAGRLSRPVVRILEPGRPAYDVDLAQDPSISIEGVGWTVPVVDALSMVPA